MTTAPLRLAVLISGTGRSLKNLIDRINDGSLNAVIPVVISSDLTAQGLEFARAEGIPTHIVERDKQPSDDAFSHEIFAPIRAAGVDLIVMAGFIKLLPIPPDFANQVINIHPALMPAFSGKGYYGQKVHEAVIQHKAEQTGCTVHFVDNEYDHGPIILQRTVPVREDDTAEQLAKRVFAEELNALPEAIRLIASGRVRVQEEQVSIAPL